MPEAQHLPTIECQERMLMIVAFNAYHERNAPIPPSVVETYPRIVTRLTKRGIFDFDGLHYWITQYGLSLWWHIVNDYVENHSVNSTHTILKFYNSDGTRNERIGRNA